MRGRSLLVPGSAPVRDKMTYSSGRAALQKTRTGWAPTEQHFSSCGRGAAGRKPTSEAARKAQQMEVMTDVERLRSRPTASWPRRPPVAR